MSLAPQGSGMYLLGPSPIAASARLIMYSWAGCTPPKDASQENKKGLKSSLPNYSPVGLCLLKGPHICLMAPSSE